MCLFLLYSIFKVFLNQKKSIKPVSKLRKIFSLSHRSGFVSKFQQLFHRPFQTADVICLPNSILEVLCVNLWQIQYFSLACQLWAEVSASVTSSSQPAPAFDNAIHAGNFPLLLLLHCFSALDFCAQKCARETTCFVLLWVLHPEQEEPCLHSHLAALLSCLAENLHEQFSLVASRNPRCSSTEHKPRLLKMACEYPLDDNFSYRSLYIPLRVIMLLESILDVGSLSQNEIGL